MAQKKDYSLPFNDLTQYIPNRLQNPVSKGLMDNLFNKFMTRDESVPFYGYVGQKPTGAFDRAARIPQATVERDLNAVVPVLNFKVGSETIAFTVQDLLNKAKVQGMDTGDLSWLYSQGNNFKPPINFDKFTNFFDYYWVANALPTPAHPVWNPEGLPEYYVIAQPALTDLEKLNCAVGTLSNTVLTGSGFIDQTFTLTFINETQFTVSVSAPLEGPGGLYEPTWGVFTLSPLPVSGIPDFTDTFTLEVRGALGDIKLLSFSITREAIYDTSNVIVSYTSFATGDVFNLETSYLSPNYNISYSIGPGVKGKITSVKTLSDYQTVDGYRLQAGDRVLVKAQDNAAENGIYIVSPKGWSRAADLSGDTLVAGARVYLVNGASGQTLWSNPVVDQWVQVGAGQSNTNDWQEGNYWLKGSELAARGFDLSKVSQAARPIIEFDSGLQLNSHVTLDGRPGEGVSNYKSVKMVFGQVPLFDLFRYDGTHAGLVSPIFYYVEDAGAELDVDLQRRLKKSTNSSADMLFNHGCADSDGRLLFFKVDGSLKTVWQAGPLGPVVLDSTFVGAGNGVLVDVQPGATTQQQTWTISAISPTRFSLSGSKMPQVPGHATVGVPFDNGDLSFTITAGSEPFVVGDTFIVRVGNLERPRYSFRATDESVQDLYGGAATDTTGRGAYQVSRTFYNNPYNESRAEIPEGALYSHFRSILGTGSRLLPVDYSLGGNIKLWSEQHTLLASILMQRDFTFTSMIDMSKRQYDNALNVLRDIYQKTIVDYFSQVGVVTSVSGLVDYLLSVRAQDNDVRTVLFDSTSGVTGFPITLPQMGLSAPVAPYQLFDKVLGINVLVHHDGHLSGQYLDTFEFRDSILGNYLSKQVLRSDGTETPAIGSFNEVPPVRPYKGELWMRTVNGVTDILAFDVQFDTPTTPVGEIGDRWFQRGPQQLRVFDGTEWVLQPDHLIAWVQVDFAAIINAVLLEVETRLYQNVNPTQRQYDFSEVLAVPEFQAELQRELFNFAAQNELDPLGTDYQAGDAFTWNYSGSNPVNLAPLSGVVPARWYNVLLSHQATVPGVIPTERPDVEPWKLLGYQIKPVDFDSQWAADIAIPDLAGNFTFTGSVRVVDTEWASTGLAGLLTIDGIELNTGDLVLVQNKGVDAASTAAVSVANGVYSVSAGAWARVGALVANTYVQVLDGARYANTAWYLDTPVNQVGVSPVIYKQARYWSEELWQFIAAQHPALKLSVNPWTDELLPPYVNPEKSTASYALTNALPSGVALPFKFGEGSPVEEVWSRSNEYRYSLTKALARFDPLALLGFAWGFNWVEVDGIKYDGFDINLPGHQRFRLHGEPVTLVNRPACEVTNSFSSGTTTLTVTYSAYSAGGRQSFTVALNGAPVATVLEGLATTITGADFNLTLLIEDQGQPFRLGDSFNIELTGLSTLVTFQPATVHLIHGLGQTFTNALREISVDTQSSYAINAFRGWDVNMGFRSGGMLTTEDLTVYNDNDTLNDSSYQLLLKKNEIASDKWIQALRVTVFQYGTKGLTKPALTGSEYRGTEINSPAGDGADWVFRIEGYNPRYTQLGLHNLATIGAGTSFPASAAIGERFFRHDLGDVYVFNGTGWDVTQSSDIVTFHALDKTGTPLAWFRPTEVTGKTTALLPVTITGVQNLVSFLYSYISWLEAEGWRFNSEGEYNYDQALGRTRDWQLEVERLLDGIYRGIELGAGVILNPFIDRVWIEQSTGLLSQFVDNSIFDITGNPGVFDMAGTRYQLTDLRPSRGNLTSSIAATGPMFSVHAQFDEFEHLFIFKNYVNQSVQDGLLYDPFSGSRAVTYKFIGARSASQTMRPEFGGHFNLQGKVLQNLQASTDGLQRAYDANYAFDNQKMSQHALSLLGFTPKTYLSDLDISDKTQFNFWRGLIQAKGTNLSVDAYLNNDRFQSAKIDEYWAYKIAEYGDSRQLSYPELKIEVQDCLQQFTLLQFDAAPNNILTNFTQIDRLDESRWFSLDDLDQDAYFKAEVVGTYIKDVTAGEIVTVPFIADRLIPTGVITNRLNSTSLEVTTDGTLTVVGYGPAVPRYNPVKLFNYELSELIEEIPHWHPATGQHNPIALESINIIGNLDPARYTYSTLVQGNSSYDPLRPWGDRELGRVWFDTRNLSYVPYYDETIFPVRAERLSRWGTLADNATVDIYEWVRSTVKPADYASLASVESLDADITSANKASGDVALTGTYYRDRQWSIRPVAWSKTGSVFGGHPSFNNSYSANLSAIGDIYTIDRKTFAEFGVVEGMRIGAWDPNPADPKPLSEAIVIGSTKTILYDDGPFSAAGYEADGNYAVSIENTDYTAAAIGDYVFSAIPIVSTTGNGSEWNTKVQLSVLNASTGIEDVITMHDLTSTDTTAGTPATSGTHRINFSLAPTPNTATGLATMTAGVPAVPGTPLIPAKPATNGKVVLTFSKPISASDPTYLTGNQFIIRAQYGSGPLLEVGQNLGSPGGFGAPASPGVYNFEGVLNHIRFAVSGLQSVEIVSNTIVITLNSPNIPLSFEMPYLTQIGANVVGPFQPGQEPAAGISVGSWQPGSAATAEVPATPGTPAIPPGPITYTANITVDSVNYTVSALGSSVQNFGGLLAAIDTAVPGTVSLSGTSIIVTSPTTGTASSVVISSSTLFSGITGFAGLGQSIIGANELPPVFTDPYHAARLTFVSGQLLTFQSTLFGIGLTVRVDVGGTYTPNVLRDAIVLAMHTHISIRDAVFVSSVVDIPSLPLSGVLSNDESDPVYVTNGGIGWRAWEIPTQAELDVDGQQPLAVYRPYLGDFRPMPTLSQAQLADAIAYGLAPLTLNNGTSIQRYQTGWSEWFQLLDTAYPQAPQSPVAATAGNVVFEHTENIIANRTTVYVNGIAQLKSAYSIVGRVLTVLNVPRGHTVTAIIRRYNPTAEELAFNPDVQENLTYQRQYKIDYEYSEITVRGVDGAPPTTFYYFWVKNRSVTAFNKKLSTQAIARYLVTGPESYLTFQNLLGPRVGAPYRYDAISISGLSYLVTKDDTFKLRFTRNFTLRDDPQQLELKNTHTEWGLIRPTQKTRIPEQLWNKLVDSMAGQDAAGNQIPSLRRVLYDERTGSSISYGFGPEQTLAPAELLRSSVQQAILNTKLTTTTATGDMVPDFIKALDFSQVDVWFSDSVEVRKTMTTIWALATPSQINEIFFAALDDILANNLEMTDIFKTSRLSAFSTRAISQGGAVPIYD